MNAKQFAWVYLIEHGMAGKEPSYYGGEDYHEDTIEEFSDEVLDNYIGYSNKNDIVRNTWFANIRKFGVDWDKTKSPQTKNYSLFMGTFADSNRVEEHLIGTLVLNNGSKQFWCAPAIEVTNVFEMMEHASQGLIKFNEIFKGPSNAV